MKVSRGRKGRSKRFEDLERWTQKEKRSKTADAEFEEIAHFEDENRHASSALPRSGRLEWLTEEGEEQYFHEEDLGKTPPSAEERRARRGMFRYGFWTAFFVAVMLAIGAGMQVFRLCFIYGFRN